MTTMQDESYSGDSSYRYVDGLVNNDDSELLIVSPYISNHYIKMLVGKSGSKRIRVITSNSSLGYKDSTLNRYVVGSIKNHIKAIAFILFLDIISVFLQFGYTTIILTVVLLVLAALTYRKYRLTDANFKVKVAKDRFVHEKLYIGSDIAIVGSANLTYNGMHRNIEHIDVVREKDKISKLRSHFESLWHNN